MVMGYRDKPEDIAKRTMANRENARLSLIDAVVSDVSYAYKKANRDKPVYYPESVLAFAKSITPEETQYFSYYTVITSRTFDYMVEVYNNQNQCNGCAFFNKDSEKN